MRVVFSRFLKKGLPSFTIILLLHLSAFSQNFSTMGTNFWLGFMENLGTPTLHVFISSEVNTAGTISIPLQGWTQNFTVTAGTTTEIIVPAAQAHTIGSGAFPNGIHIVADEDVAVYALNYVANTADATVVAPVKTLGNHYYVMAYTDGQAPYSSASEFLIVAVYDNTTVEITPSVATTGGNAANTPFQVTLHAGEVFQVQSNSDLSGSLVRSFDNGSGCQNFAVFAGNICTGVICAYCDHLKEQMFPTGTWGKEYLLAPLLTRAEDRYRVQASVNGTQITINGGPPINLNAGQHYQFNTGQATVVQSNNPVSVMQFSMGSECDNTSTDPFTINLSPVEQTLKQITFNAFTSSIITNYYLNVLTTSANVGLVSLDGTNIAAQFTTFPSDPTYAYARLNITQGNHTLVSDSGILAYVYGYGQDESYGYSAGANLSDLSASIHFQVGDYTELDSVVFICPDDTILFIGEGDSSIIGWEWLMGDGSYYAGDTISHSYADYGIYTVKLLVERVNMCSKDTLEQIMEVTGPRTNIVEADSLCFGDDIQLSVSGGDAYVWSTGDSTNSIFVSPVRDTIYWVYAIDSLCPGMPDTVDISVINIAADFTQTTVCIGDTTFFNDNSVLQNDSVLNWNWDFDDNAFSNIQDPNHIYNSAGNYNVKLSIESSFGCRDSIEKVLLTNPIPQAQIAYENTCEMSEVQFTDSSTLSAGAILSWHWDFGDSTNSSLQHPVHTYDSAGIYSVQLIITTDNSCTDTVVEQIQVYERPIANFTVEDICNKLPSAFIDSSSSADGNINNWLWDFGDGNTANGQVQEHLYANPGTYTVKLIIESEYACIDSISKNTIVFPKPVADFTATNVCFGDTSNISSNSSILSGSFSCTYNFGDNYMANVCDTNHFYSAPGNYSIELIVESDNACLDTINKTVEIYHIPEAGFSFTDHCFSTETIFSDTSKIQEGSIDTWHWDLGDNSLSNDTSPVHNYAAAGSYDIQVSVSSNFDCKDTAYGQITIFPLPTADFEVDPVCFGISSDFRNNSSISSGTIDTYNWDFKDGNLSNQENPQHDFARANTQQVELEVVSNNNCRDIIVKPAIVYALPDVNFIFDNSCLGDSSFFQDNSDLSDGQINTYSWTISDGRQDANANFSHLFTDTGIYNIKLIVESDLTCVDSNDANIEIYELPEFLAYIDPACYGENDGGIQFEISHGTAPYTVSWSDGENAVQRAELYSGNYYATVSDVNNCWRDTMLFVPQPARPVLLSITPDSSEIVFGTEIELLVTGNLDPYLVYQWENKEFINCTDCQDPIVNPLDYTIYTVEATDTQGCTGKASAEVYVDFDYIFFAPNAFTPNNDGNNDTFKVFARGVKNFEMKIFDRWGELLFQSNDIEEGWDAYYQNKLLTPAVFVYHVEIEYLNNYKKAYKGSFTLIR